MHKFLACMALFAISTVATATEMMWYWDSDGATKGLLPDPNCQCYFSFEFPVKVIPKAGAYFTLYDTKSQIVTLKLSEFLKPLNKSSEPSTILTKHLDYEFNYLKGVVGKDHLLLERKDWDKSNMILSWVVERQSGNKSSYLVFSSTVKSGCVFYLSSMVSNRELISKIVEGQKKSLFTLKSHMPTSEEEAKKLINEFSKS